METFNLNQHLNPNHAELFGSTDFELVVRGGANAGKTYSIADKLLMQPILQPNVPLKALIVRKTLPRLRSSTIEIIEKRAKLFKLPFNLNQNTMRAHIGNMIFDFTSLNNKDDYEKIRSMTDVDFVWCNEVPELNEDDYELLRTRIRGGQSSFAQFITDFNPIGKTTWVFKRLFEKNIGNARKLKYTILDNPWASQQEIERLKATRNYNLNFYNIYFEGEWGELEAIIYSWDIVDRPPGNPDEIFYGGDFGYSIDPAAYIKIYRKADEFWVEEIFYEKGLTNPAIARKIKEHGSDRSISYWDCAEPKSIQELYDLKVNVLPCEKGPDSVRAGIDYLQSKDIHIIDGSENIIRECRSYVNKTDKDGNYLPEPINFNNHTMDGIRYGVFTHMKTPPAGLVAVSKGDVY